ncbi:hypothetical protein H181DRAFT_05527 [Streptomyces sp. WMMB 714]|nr:hypothetical protein H181DRAFT_05527 [Streptomyces sp. WMMB 714]
MIVTWKYSGRLKYAEKARAYRLIGAAAFALFLTSLVTAALHPDRAAEALYLAGAITVTCLIVGAARQLMLNRLMRAPALRPKRLSRRQRVVDAQQHDVHAVYRRPQHSEDDDDLTRFTLFGEESPFIGAGELVYQWNPPMCLQLLRPGDEKTPLHEREYLEPPFEAYELVDHLREAVEQLDTDTGDVRLPTRAGHRIYIAETDVAADRNLLPSRIEEVDIRRIINTPGCKQHHFLEITTAIEGAEFVAIVLLHVSLRGRTLSISTAACVLTNTPRSFQRTAEFGQNGAVAVTWEAFRQLSTLPEEIQRSWRITRYLFALSKAAFLPRDLTSAPIRSVLIGTRVSAREKTSQAWSKIQLEKTELLGRMKIIEQRILGAASDFLRDKDIDVSEFDDRALKIINSGIIAFGDNNNFNNNAVGDGSQVGGSGNQPVGPNAQGSGGTQ